MSIFPVLSCFFTVAFATEYEEPPTVSAHTVFPDFALTGEQSDGIFAAFHSLLGGVLTENRGIGADIGGYLGLFIVGRQLAINAIGGIEPERGRVRRDAVQAELYGEGAHRSSERSV